MKRRFIFAILFLTFLSAASASLAVQPDEMLQNSSLEARARAISKDLRCLVCQNESIDDSNAELAHDLRLLVRQRLMAGDSDDQAKQYIVSRYGDYVLLKPPLQENTLVLWLGPAVLLIFGLTGVILFYRHRQINAALAPLSRDENSRLNKLLREHPGDDKAS